NRARGLDRRPDVRGPVPANADDLRRRPAVDPDEGAVELHSLVVGRLRQLVERVERQAPDGLRYVHAATLAAQRSSTTFAVGCEQQMSALPSAGGSTGSGRYSIAPATRAVSQV